MFTVITALLQLAAWVLAGFVAVASLSAILFAQRPLLGVAQHWGLQLWWLALLGGGAAAWLEAWPAFAACALCAAGWSLRLFRRPASARAAAANAATAEPLLRLMVANLHYSNRDYDRIRAAIAASAADVIVLIEATPESRDRLAGLAATHPHAADSCDLSAHYGIVVRARRPLRVLSRSGGGDGAPRHVWVTLQLDQAPVDLIAVHLTNPIRHKIAWRIPGEIDALITQANRAAPDLILCGDCNAAGWSSWLRRLEAATGLGNTGRLQPSWPVPLPAPLRLPLDHAWARGRVVVGETRLGPRTGSDHFPLLAEIGWRGPPQDGQ